MKNPGKSARRSQLGMWPVLILTWGAALEAQSPGAGPGPSEPKRRVEARYINTPIVLDGELDEPAWGEAEAASGFLQQSPVTGRPSTERTEVRILYDDRNLYFGVYCFDSGGPEALVVNDVERDFYQFDSDSFGMMLDTFDDDRNGFLFNTNPQGAKFDSQVGGNGSTFNRNWDTIWHVKSKITSQGWQVEMAIPFQSLRFTGSKNQTWGVNFQRRIRRKNEDTFWSLPQRPFSMARISTAGVLEGIGAIPSERNLRLKPFLSAPVTRAAGDDTDFKPEVGLDLKYGLTSQMTLDFTVNTDFAQVEADDQQINLTRFSLFFPEKREFFLENAPLFQFGRQGGRFRQVAGRFEQVQAEVIPFFSRRIGISEGSMVPVLGGLRVTGRAGAYTLGMFSMQTDRFGATPSENFSVVRVRRDIFNNSDLGGIFVNKQSGQGHNRTYGVDGNFSFSRRLETTLFLMKTDSPGIREGDTAGQVLLMWRDPRLRLEAQHTFIGENFDPEVGFVPRRGIDKSFGRLAYVSRPGERISWIRELMPLLQVEYITDPERNLLTRRLEPRLWVEFNSGARLSLAQESRFERLTEPFLIRSDLAIPVGDYSFSQYSLTLSSDQSRMFTGEVTLTSGEFFDGDRDSYQLGLGFRRGYRFETRLSWSHNDVRLGNGSFSTDLVNARLQYAFNTDMFLNALIQYNSDTRAISSNIRFNLIHRPLSDFFLIYNERRLSGGEVAERALIAKLTYSFNL